MQRKEPSSAPNTERTQNKSRPTQRKSTRQASASDNRSTRRSDSQSRTSKRSAEQADASKQRKQTKRSADTAAQKTQKPKTRTTRKSAKREGNNHVIVFDHVTKTYEQTPDKPALDDVSLTIDQGEFVFLVGHSGSGKSTMIRSIIREVVPEKGHLEVGGMDLINMRKSRVPYLRRNVGCVFQDYKLLPNKTAYENVAFAMECIGASQRKIREHVPQVLTLVGLGDKMDKFPDELSGGEQQRVSIARAIINQPPLIVADEPTGSLDPRISDGIMELLLAINDTGITVVVATHNQDIVDRMHKRVVRLSKGKIVKDEEEGSYV